EVVRDITSRYAVDGIHLDYVRYPGVDFDYSKAQRTAFALRYGVDPLWSDRVDINAEEDILGAGAASLIDSLYTHWRVAQVDSLVEAVRAVTNGIALSAAVIPESETARIGKGQDWVGWVHRRMVDFVVPMAYTYEPDELATLVTTIRRTVGAGYFLMGLPVFDGRERYLGYSVSLLRREDILGYALFSYNELEKEPFSIQFLERVFLGEDSDGENAGDPDSLDDDNN
ncbi:MAG: family 10 glycosylhydrolase, partial [Candidatus Latescibacterota bacterium]